MPKKVYDSARVELPKVDHPRFTEELIRMLSDYQTQIDILTDRVANLEAKVP